MNAIEDTGIFNEPNTIWDISHPYYFENHVEWGSIFVPTVQNAEAWAENYRSTLSLWSQKIGGSKCYIAETFMFTRPCGETMNQPPQKDVQLAFWVKIVNMCVEYKISFNILGAATAAPNTVNSGSTFSICDLHTEAIDQSNYRKTEIGLPSIPPITPPPITPNEGFILAITGFGAIGAAIIIKEKKRL